ncbi:hypothetical protein ElyMa_005155300 [Elysia marginata]|uniref:Uncharacterized protein n=1 Tax=Elysia marginata TaxID=1093978 RepID=A0AAV4JSJ6_9GAST|nr:hypothetical protein ElyMa_005155300 [Elysia marginata]
MADQLARFRTGRTETHTVNNVIKAAFKQLQQVRTCCALDAICFLVVATELLFQYAVDTTNLLLLTQLNTIVGQTTTTLTVLARNGFSAAF